MSEYRIDPVAHNKFAVVFEDDEGNETVIETLPTRHDAENYVRGALVLDNYLGNGSDK